MEVCFRQTRYSFLFCVLVIITINDLIPQVSCETDRMTKGKMIKDRILKNYDKYVRPTNGTNTTEVYVSYLPRQIIELDEERSLLHMDSYIYMSWFDSRLKWDTSEFDEQLQFPSSMLWVPDISVHNSHSEQVDPAKDVLIALSPNGRLLWVPPALTQTVCSTISQTSYPYDEVECMIQIGSWVHDGWEIHWKHDDYLYTNNFVNINPRWEMDLEKSRSYRNVTIYDCCPEPYINVRIFCHLRRRPVPEIEATRTPCILVMILALSIFWFPVDSSTKLLLGGILFLVLNLLLAYVGYSTRAPLMVLYGVSFIQTSMYLVVITILLQVFVVIKVASLSGPSRPPAIVMQWLTGSLGKYACLRSSLSEDNLPLDRMQLKEDSSPIESMSARDEWKLFAAAIDRTLFVVMFIVTISVHHL